MESTRIETEPLRDFLATDMEWTADIQEAVEEQTADLPEEIGECAPTTNKDESQETGASSAPQAFEATCSSEATDNAAERTSGAGTPATGDFTLAPMPKQRAFGFFAFAACALVAVLTNPQRPGGSSHPTTKAGWTGNPLATALQASGTQLADSPANTHETGRHAAPQSKQTVDGKRRSYGSSASLGLVTFDSPSFTTSEGALAAVFIVRRTQVVTGGAVVQWAARSGSADAGIDFSDASGTVRFADGQQQIAIYVPLRNDLLKEQDETFEVCLRSPRQARLGQTACAEATIRDNDDASPI